MSAIDLISGFSSKGVAALLIPPELPAVIKSLHNSKESARRVSASTTTNGGGAFSHSKSVAQSGPGVLRTNSGIALPFSRREVWRTLSSVNIDSERRTGCAFEPLAPGRYARCWPGLLCYLAAGRANRKRFEPADLTSLTKRRFRSSNFRIARHPGMNFSDRT